MQACSNSFFHDSCQSIEGRDDIIEKFVSFKMETKISNWVKLFFNMPQTFKIQVLF